MNVLFVSSGNWGEPSIIIKNQAESIIKKNVNIDFFLIKGKGVLGYLKNVRKLRTKFRNGHYDLIHAHYSLSGFVAALSGRFPLVVSLMGSDAFMGYLWKAVSKFFYYTKWDITIVKTNEMKDSLKMKKAIVIPNGVNIDRFKEINKEHARDVIDYHKDSKLVIFIADPSRVEKNYSLAKQSVSKIKDHEVELLAVYNVDNNKIPYYLNAADALVLTSFWEGSVNVVKEAMACNLPIVSTKVGDVSENIQDLENCFVCDWDTSQIAEKLQLILNSNKKSNGRQRIFSLNLDSDTTADRIVEIYKKLIKKNE